MSADTETVKPLRPAWVGKAAGVFLALLLLVFGVYSLHQGIAPIREARYELGSNAHDWAMIFFSINAPQGDAALVLTGAEGRRAGLALAAFGALFITWALVMLLTTFPPPPRVRRWSIVLAAWSVANLAAVSLLGFPPWRIGAMWSPVAFWGTVMLLGSFLALAKAEAWKPWLGWGFAGLCVIAVAGGYFTAAVPAGIILAVFATLAGAVNAYFLIPSFRAKIQHLRASVKQEP